MDQKKKTPPAQEEQTTVEQRPGEVTRRGFLKGMGTVIAASSIPIVSSACSPVEQQGVIPQPPLSNELQYSAVPPAPDIAPEPGILRFFTPLEARTVEAYTARLLPGTPEDPGAREARVLNYIDYQLSFDEGFHEATYRFPPYAEVYEGDAPPAGADPGIIWVPASEIERYGYQSPLTPREVFRIGVPGINAVARARFGAVFPELTDEQQDEIITAMVNGEVDEYFEPFGGNSFFHVLRRFTSEGMFSDPAYGGNWDMVGWRLIGYPGAQRAYTPDEIKAIDTDPRQPQSLHELHWFNPGQEAGRYVVLPVSGSNEGAPRRDAYWPANEQLQEGEEPLP